MKPQIIKTTIALVFGLLFSVIGIAQEENNTVTSIKPLRLGVKIGVPNIATINAEYVTPLLNNRVALTLDYMSLNRTIDDTEIKYNNFEIGTNIYFSDSGKGLYGSITYFSFDGEGTFLDVEFGPDDYGDGKGTIAFNTLNMKLGAKLGRTFYFRIEAGYGFGKIPEEITVTSNDGSKTATEEIPEIPGIASSGIPVFNFGIGFSFL